jgi:L,D-transpeptidase ErfK/SrfK
MKRLSWLPLLLAGLIGTAQATVYELPADGASVVGTDIHIKTVFKDTLLDIARRNSLGYYEIIRANPGVDMWLPGEGTDVMLPGRRILPPGPREGIVVNLPEHRLYYYPKPKKGEKPVVITYPVSIGKMDWKTPIGETRVIQKEKHPNWYPPESVRKEHIANGDPIPAIVKAGPDNPLGDYAMRLAAGNGTYLIHGTNNPMAVGMAITHGCVRMYPEDVAALFPLIPVGTKVWLINEPVKVAFVDGELFLEAHPQVDEEGQNTSTEPDLNLLSDKLDQALGTTTAAIHWDFAKEALQAANGIPTVVGLEADPDPAPSSEPAATPSASTPAVSTPPAAAPSSTDATAHAPSTDVATKSASAAGTADVTKPAQSVGTADAPDSASSAGTADAAADLTKTAAASSTAAADTTNSAPSAGSMAGSPTAAGTSTKPGADSSVRDGAGTSANGVAGASAKDGVTQTSSADAANTPPSATRAADPSAAASASTAASDTPADDPPTTVLRPVLRPVPPAGAAAESQPDSAAPRTASASPEH